MKPFTSFASALFALVALVHLLRLVIGFDLVIAGWAVPMWISVVGFIIPSALSFGLWREAKR